MINFWKRKEGERERKKKKKKGKKKKKKKKKKRKKLYSTVNGPSGDSALTVIELGSLSPVTRQ